MYLDYSKLEFDEYGVPETPTLILKTLSEETIGVIPGVYNLSANIKFSEPSELSFDVPSIIDGTPNPVYERITGRKIVYTANYGIYVTMNPVQDSDGISNIKHVQCYSIEKRLEDKRFFLEEGTFCFWNPASPTDTVLGRIVETAAGWSVGYVSPTLYGRYRTFEQYDDYLLSFVYNTAPEKYRCVFVFDPYLKEINVYDADEPRSSLPIYLDFDNLVETLEIEEISDELITAMRPYGSAGLDIRAVNPIGTNWIYDLSHFIECGDIPQKLTEKWNAWQSAITTHQEYYNGLIGIRASNSAKLLMVDAELVELRGQLTDLTNQQSIIIQTIASEVTEAGKESQKKKLDEINDKIAAKKAEIKRKEDEKVSIQTENDRNTALIQAEVDSLSITKYFTADEYSALSEYFIEQDMTDETFVSTDIDTSISGTSSSVVSCHISISKSEITKVDMTKDFQRELYVLAGGLFTISGDITVSCDIIRGTVDANSDGSYVLSLLSGEIKVGDKTAPSGLITISGKMSGLVSDIKLTDDGGLQLLKGTSLDFDNTDGTLFMTANASEYQKYSVQMELYEHAKSVLHDKATPTYEFSVKAGNFLFAKEFEPFRNQLELGRGVYLNVGDSTILPLIIEFEIDFENRADFSLVFSNRFKRHDKVNTLKDMVESSYSSGRSFDAGKYIYNQSADQSAAVSKFMNGSLDASKNTIIGASNQKIKIDGAGIHVGGNSKYQIRIVDSMIAMTDDNWDSAKLAIGLFSSPEIGTYWGVNADVIGGKLLVGNNLVIENKNDTGVMQFKVDSSGAWLNNSTFVLQKDNGGKMMLDPKYGLVAGNKDLFTTNGTTVSPSFVNPDGSISLDEDGMPVGSNFYLDIRNGNAYFRGGIAATSGRIGGFKIESDFLSTGSGGNYVALNGSGSNENSAYAIWAGSDKPSSAKFYVKKDGTLYAKDGIFGGTLQAAKVSGALTAQDENSWIVGCGIKVNNGTFMVDQAGNVTMNGNLTLRNGSISWANLNTSVTNKINAAHSAGTSAESIARRIAAGEFYEGSFINGKEIFGPKIYSNMFTVVPEDRPRVGEWNGGFTLKGYYGDTLMNMLEITYADNGTNGPAVIFQSPSRAYALWDFMYVRFKGSVRFNKDVAFTNSVDFSRANVTGIYAQFG